MSRDTPGLDIRKDNMGRPSEKTLIQKHAIDYLKVRAQTAEQRAFTFLQMTDDPNEQLMYCEAMDHWKSVQILIEQRDKLQKYVRLLIKAEGEETTAEAAEQYLEEIGIEL